MKLNKKDPIRHSQKLKKLHITSSRFDYSHMSRNAEQALNYIKRKDRPQHTLSQWRMSNFFLSDATQQLFNCPDQIPRENAEQLTIERFQNQYEKNKKAVIIKGLTKDWYKGGKWSYQDFYDKFKDVKFKIGEDQDGYKLRTPFKYYLQYLIYNQDDSPLYMFESSLENNSKMMPIIDWYKVPPYFQDDLFKLAGQKKRPPYRWLLMGPERSGTTIHIDPIQTSAWNTSLFGHKRWVLMDPQLPKSIVKGNRYRYKNYQDQAINYFVQILPKIIQDQGRQNLGIIEFIQYPGETVFVPGGWWHAVINLDDTMAVTQNVMTHINFNTVWRSLRRQRRKFSSYFLSRLRQNEISLYEKALSLNTEDNFTMGQKYQKQSISLSFSESQSSSSSSSSSDSSSQSSLVNKGNKKQRANKRSKSNSRQNTFHNVHDRSRNKKLPRSASSNSL